MVIGELKYLERQAAKMAGLRKAFDFLSRSSVRDLADGKVPIDGERVFAIVQRYETTVTMDPKFEYHRKYIDVQFVSSGREIIGWAPSAAMRITEAYDQGKDIAFGSIDRKQWTPLLVHEGHAVVLWPEDGHAPRLAAGDPSTVMKIVVKVSL